MMEEKVTVVVNGRPATFFLGLRVRHAIGSRAARAVEQRRATVRDAAGNEVGLDGALYDGEVLIVHRLAAGPQASAQPRQPDRQSRITGGDA